MDRLADRASQHGARCSAPRAGGSLAALLASCAALLGGCASEPEPLIRWTMDEPMQVLSVPGSPPLQDGRFRFRQIFCQVLTADPEYGAEPCERYLHRASDEPAPPEQVAPLPDWPRRTLRVVVVPGLFSDCVQHLARPFQTAIERLDSPGVNLEFLQVSGRSGSDTNARAIADYLAGMEPEPGQDLVLVGHSKGAVDILHFLVGYPELAERVSAVISVAGAINGSPRADRLEDDYAAWLSERHLGFCDPGDGRGVEYLTRAYRLNWLVNNRLPSAVQYYSIVAIASPDNISLNSRVGYRAMRQVDPRNDGQLLFYDQVIPGATVLAYANANHWSVAIPVSDKHPVIASTIITHNAYPRTALLEAALRYVDEQLPVAQGVTRAAAAAPQGQTR